MKINIKISLLALSCFFSLSTHALSPHDLWQDNVTPATGSVDSLASAMSGKTGEKTFAYRNMTLYLEGLSNMLSGAPLESTSKGVRFKLPHPDGGFIPLQAFYSPVMEAALEEKYPQLRTYKVVGVGGQQISGRMGFSDNGFYAYLDTPEGEVAIESDVSLFGNGNGSGYRVFFTDDARAATRAVPDQTYSLLIDDMTDGTRELPSATLTGQNLVEPGAQLGEQLRVYRLAMSMKAEMTQALGGTKAKGMAFIVKAVNILNQIYEKELSIRLILVANNDALVYTNPNTDPFEVVAYHTKENRENIHAVIGAENYDLGHLLTYRRGSSSAALAQACVDSANYLKASALTRMHNLNEGIWQRIAVDYLAHEIGHQFGATHTQGKSTCHAWQQSAWEMFSGSTIMAYAGVCSPSLQSHSDPVFHAGSRRQIIDFINERSQCGTLVETGDIAPTLDAGADYVIPVNTPFVLSAVSEDIDAGDGETQTFTWDQVDSGPMELGFGSGEIEWVDPGKGPLFRSIAPTSSPERVFPKLETILAGKTANFGETLPSTNRDINFLVTVRSGAYGVAEDTVKLTSVTSAGPFKVLSPVGTSFISGDDVPVIWDVAGTDLPPVNCANVDIALSLDGGVTFDIALKNATANDGEETVSLPNLSSDKMRFRVKCSDNIFFAISLAENNLVR